MQWSVITSPHDPPTDSSTGYCGHRILCCCRRQSRIEAVRGSRANATQFVGCKTDAVKYVTRIERFVQGDYPMVCARSGLPATKMVPVQARRSTVWPWFLLPLSIVWFVVAKWAADSDHPWGMLPFAEGHVDGITATYEKSIGVIIDGAHPAFVEATRKSQAAAQSSISEQSGPVALGDPLIESSDR